jgi:hypothetical protein
MARTTFQRWLAVLSFGFLGASMAFVAGARAGAALNGHVNGLTFANAPMPRLPGALERAPITQEK